MLKPVVVPCPRCGTPVKLLVSDQFCIVNGPYMSAAIVQHPEHFTCASCGTICAPALAGIGDLKVIATPVPPRETTQRVIGVG